MNELISVARSLANMQNREGPDTVESAHFQAQALALTSIAISLERIAVALEQQNEWQETDYNRQDLEALRMFEHGEQDIQ